MNNGLIKKRKEVMVNEELKRKIWKLPLIVWLMIMLFIGVALGVVMYTLTIPGTITIEPPAEGTYEIKVYSDADGTQELTSVDFGTAHAGDGVPFSFYVKNTGTATIQGIKMTIKASGLTQLNYGTILSDLGPQQIRYVSQTFWVPGEAGAGTYSVEIIFEVYA